MEEKEAERNGQGMSELLQAGRHEKLPDKDSRMAADEVKNLYLEKLEDDWK